MNDPSRPALWVIGALVVFSLLLCGVVVVGGLYVSGQLEAQQREIEALRATARPATEVATTMSTPRVVTTPVVEATTPARRATEVATTVAVIATQRSGPEA